MAAPTVRGVSAATCSGTTSAVFTLPASTAQGDLLFIVCETSDSSTLAGTPNTPTDWDKIFENTVSGGGAGVSTLTVFARVAPASPADTTVDGVGDHICGRMLGVTAGTHGVTTPATDIDVGTPTDHGINQAGNTTASLTVTADSLILWCIGVSDDALDGSNVANETNANFASITPRWENSVSDGAGGGSAVVTATCAGTSTGAGTWDHDTGAASQSVYIAVPPVTVTTVTAVFAAPLGSLAATATATPEHPAVFAAPLGALVGAVAATVEHPATLAAPLGSLTGAAAATPEHPAVLAAPLGSLTAAATATASAPKVNAVFAAPLGALVGAAAASVDSPPVKAVSVTTVAPMASSAATVGKA